MPKDYFEVEEVQEHVSEEEKQAKVIKAYRVIFYTVSPLKMLSWQG